MDENLKMLIEAINSDKKRGVSNARSIKRHLVELECVLDSGIPLKKFVDDLIASGFKCTYRTVQNILYWHRKSKKLNQAGDIMPTVLNNNESPKMDNSIKTNIKDDSEKQTPKEDEEENALYKIDLSPHPNGKRKTLKEISAEVDKMFANNKRPLY